MTSRELLALVAQLATPVFLAGLGVFFAWAKRKLDAATDNQRLLGAVDLLSHGAHGIVATLSQSVVRDLKDPNKPGTWNDVARTAVKDTAVLQLKQLYPHAVAELARSNPEKVQELLGTFVEAAVLKYKKP